jgi:hypothetical protein
MILAIELLLLPTLERRFQGKVEEIVVQMSLDTNTAYHLPFGHAGLVLQEEIVLKQREVREDSEICFTQVNKNGDLKVGFWIQMNQFDFIVMEEVVNKFAGWETKPALEEGSEDHDLIGIGRP